MAMKFLEGDAITDDQLVIHFFIPVTRPVVSALSGGPVVWRSAPQHHLGQDDHYLHHDENHNVPLDPQGPPVVLQGQKGFGGA